MPPPCWQLIWCWRRRRWQWWWRFCPVKAGGWMITGGSRWVIILHSLTEYSIHTLLTVYSMHILHSVYSIHRHTRHYSLCILHTRLLKVGMLAETAKYPSMLARSAHLQIFATKNTLFYNCGFLQHKRRFSYNCKRWQPCASVDSNALAWPASIISMK